MLGAETLAFSMYIPAKFCEELQPGIREQGPPVGEKSYEAEGFEGIIRQWWKSYLFAYEMVA